MAALTALSKITFGSFMGRPMNMKVAALTKIWDGAHIARDASGYAVPVVATTAINYVGRATHAYDNSANASPTTERVLKVVTEHHDQAYLSGITDANLGDPVYLPTDNIADVTLTSTNNALKGHIFEVLASGEGEGTASGTNNIVIANVRKTD